MFSVAVAAWLLLAYNSALFAKLSQLGASGAGTAAGFLFAGGIIVFAVFHVVLSLATWPYVGKAVAVVLITCAAIASYFMRHYGVLIDAAAMQNVAETDGAEFLELANWSLILSVIGFGIIPSCLVAAWPIAWARPRREILYRAIALVTSLLLVAAAALPFFPTIASSLRNNRDLPLLVTPANVIRAAEKYLRERSRRPAELTRIGLDAQLALPAAAHDKPTLLLIVIGETARADHFSLGGYARDTNPRLRSQGVIWFPETRSCGTSTAVSLPCLFSDLGRTRFSRASADTREGLLDVVQRAGYYVLWRDNNSGCKSVCDRVRIEDLSTARNVDLCDGTECRDEILLHDLQARINELKGNAVIVLHQKGNHGPAYHRRYPPAFERFQPACHSSEFGNCERETIVNAYDNALLYTDYLLSQSIDLLKSNQPRFYTALIYISDHGESLGENNTYLHGMPYVIAPDAQKHVPMLMWLPAEFAVAHDVDLKCAWSRRTRSYSHDNFFHTVLGLAAVATSVYRPQLDVFSDCRAGRPHGSGVPRTPKPLQTDSTRAMA